MCSKKPLGQKETLPDVLPFMTSCTRGGTFPNSKCIYSNTVLRSNVKEFSFIFFFSLEDSYFSLFLTLYRNKDKRCHLKRVKFMWQLWLLLRLKFHVRSFKKHSLFFVTGLHFRFLFTKMKKWGNVLRLRTDLYVNTLVLFLICFPPLVSP